MAKAKTEKQTAPKADNLANALIAASENIPQKNDAAASREQVPPGQSSAGAENYVKIDEVVEVVPQKNDPAASRNQVPPGQAAPVSAEVVNIPDPQPTAKTVVELAEQTLAPVYRDPTDAEIHAYIEKRWPGKLELIVGNKSAEQERLEKLHGPGFITAYKGGNKADPRYFSQTTWKELGRNENKEGWRQEIVIPAEVLNLKK